MYHFELTVDGNYGGIVRGKSYSDCLDEMRELFPNSDVKIVNVF